MPVLLLQNESLDLKRGSGHNEEPRKQTRKQKKNNKLFPLANCYKCLCFFLQADNLFVKPKMKILCQAMLFSSFFPAKKIIFVRLYPYLEGSIFFVSSLLRASFFPLPESPFWPFPLPFEGPCPTLPLTDIDSLYQFPAPPALPRPCILLLQAYIVEHFHFENALTDDGASLVRANEE